MCDSTADRMLRTFKVPSLSSSTRIGRRTGQALITFYRYALAPLLAWDCRHLPTCSEYAEEAIDRFGLWAGGWLTLARLLRCHPFGTSGLDFVPSVLPEQSRWYMPWRYGSWRMTNSGPR
jgi:putative membrane protein insertion efficiency factor